MARRELDAAEATLRQILELQSDASHVYAYLTVIDLQRGDAAAARRDAALEPEGFWREYATTMALHVQGDRAAADRALAALIAKYGYGGTFQIAMIYAMRKEPDKAFEWLEKAYTVRDSGLIQLLVTPYLLDYRTDPRFIAIGRKLKIDESVLARAVP